MTLDRTRWIVRLFFWSLGILDEFTDGDRYYTVPHTGTNLCTFFQSTFVLAPLVLLLHLVVYGLILAALTAAPIYLFGASGYFSFVGAIASLLAIVFGAVWLGSVWKDHREKAERNEREATGPSSAGIAWQFVVAQKRKVCPLISFNGARS